MTEDGDGNAVTVAAVQDTLYVTAKDAGIYSKPGEDTEKLADVFRRYTDRPVYCKERLEDAVRTAMNERGETGEIYCLGSLYLVGMMKKLLAGGAIDA